MEISILREILRAVRAILMRNAAVKVAENFIAKRSIPMLLFHISYNTGSNFTESSCIAEQFHARGGCSSKISGAKPREL